MTRKSGKLALSWSDIEGYVEKLCNDYSHRDLTGVYGLPRGGLVPAVMISHRLNIPLLMAPMDNCLIVDDIYDSGESLCHYIKNSSAITKPTYHIATLCYKAHTPEDRPKPDWFQLVVANDWVEFPWEVVDERS